MLDSHRSDRIPHAKGRKVGPTLRMMRGLAEKFHHPLELFTAKEISNRWGHGRDYWVQFYSTTDGARQPLGGWRHLSFPDVASPEAEHHVAQVVPAGPRRSAWRGTVASPHPEANHGLERERPNADGGGDARTSIASIGPRALARHDELSRRALPMQAPKARTESDPLLTMVAVTWPSRTEPLNARSRGWRRARSARTMTMKSRKSPKRRTTRACNGW